MVVNVRKATLIKITKPARSPDILSSTGATKRSTLCSEFTLHEDDFRQGSRTFNFDAAVYGHPAVKKALIAAQHSKCCFCERKVGDDGDVEHFRPKAGVRQSSSAPMLKPGYYWLAYDWDNLLLSCSACNQRHKKNLFPLVNPDNRATSHTDNVDTEEPLFIHPAQINPEQYISFRKEVPYAIGGNRLAKETIAALGLDREILNEVRRSELNNLIFMQKILVLRLDYSKSTEGQEILLYAENYLADAVVDKSEFAGMARAAAKNNFRMSLP